MEITKLDYSLPCDLIAQRPLSKRDRARLLVLHRDTGQIEHRLFFEIVEYFNKGDMLVINNTKVIPAKLFGKKASGGKIEVLLIREKKSSPKEVVWEVMTKGSYEGDILIDESIIELRKNCNGRELVFKNMSYEEVRNFIKAKGSMPLPPYIKRQPEQSDKENYQTVYAKFNGSIAAPTAGLHFTEELLERIKDKGVILREITLHVGVGTFKPIKVKNLQEHEMDFEYFEIDKKVLNETYETRKKGKKVFSVGTTTTRALEGYASGQYEDNGSDENKIKGTTNIFIYPGYEFKMINAFITNFHLPKSTPLAMVYAFCDIDKVQKAYTEAIEKQYRFFSYGDAMLII